MLKHPVSAFDMLQLTCLCIIWYFVCDERIDNTEIPVRPTPKSMLVQKNDVQKIQTFCIVGLFYYMAAWCVDLK